MNTHILSFATSIGQRAFKDAVIHLYGLVQELTGDAESIMDERHLENLHDAWVKSRESGIGTFYIPLPSTSNNALKIVFERHGNGLEQSTVTLSLYSPHSDTELLSKWTSVNPYGKINTPTGGYKLSLFAAAGVAVMVGSLIMAVLVLGVPLWLISVAMLGLAILHFRIEPYSTYKRVVVAVLLLHTLLAALFRYFNVEWDIVITLVFCFACLGLLSFVFAITRSPSAQSLDDIVRSSLLLSVNCPRCGTPLKGDEEFCTVCGVSLTGGPATGATTLLEK